MDEVFQLEILFVTLLVQFQYKPTQQEVWQLCEQCIFFICNDRHSLHSFWGPYVYTSCFEIVSPTSPQF